MRDRKTDCWPPYDSRPEPDADKYGAELGNALKILDVAWDRAPDQESREAVDDVRDELRQMLMQSIMADTEKNDEV